MHRPILSSIEVILLVLVAIAQAQSIGFTQYPNQVISGQIYPVSWEAGGASVTISLLQGGAVQETLYTGAGTSFTWEVDDDEDGGVGYALQIVASGATSTTVTSGEIWLIEDEDGLTVNGQAIYASVPNGPASSGLVGTGETSAPAPTTTNQASSAASPAATTGAQTGVQTEVVTFTSAQSVYTFTTTVSPSQTTGDVLTFTSAGNVFTTTVDPSSTSDPTNAAATGRDGGNYGGLSAGAIAGIVIGVLLVVFLVLGLLWYRLRRRNKQRAAGSDPPESPIAAFIRGGRRAVSNRKSTTTNDSPVGGAGNEKAVQGSSVISPVSPYAASEMQAAVPMHAKHTGSSVGSNELGGSMRHEVAAMPPTYELAGDDVGRDRGSTVRYPMQAVSVSRAGTTNNNFASTTSELSGSTSPRT